MNPERSNVCREGTEGYGATVLLLLKIQVEHATQQHRSNFTSSRLGRNPGSVCPACFVPTLWRRGPSSSTTGAADFTPSNLPGSSRHEREMDAETRQTQWSRVVSFDFFCPAIDCWAHDILHLVAAAQPLSIHSFTPMVYLDRLPGSLLSCSVPSARPSIRQLPPPARWSFFPPRHPVGPPTSCS